MRFLFFTDLHFKHIINSRSDNYELSIINKVNEIIEISNKYEIDIILFGGDLFDVPNPSNSLIFNLIRLLKSFNKPIYSIIGSHDYFGYQKITLNRTAIGILNEAKIINIIDQRINEGFIEIDNIKIYGFSHTYDIYNIDNPIYVKKTDDSFYIQLVHCDLVNKKVAWDHILIGSDNSKTEADLVLSGHYHPGWNLPVKFNNSLYVNPGSIGRTERTKRIPRVFVFEVDKNNNLSYDFITLQNVIKNPFKENYGFSEDETKQDVIDPFNMSDFDSLDFINKVDFIDFAKKLGYNDEIVNIAIEYLEKTKINN